jgi:uncharacterized protein (UPF0276 family)
MRRLMAIPPLGLGIGWRPEIALFIERRTDLGWVEVVAENVSGAHQIPRAVVQLRERGMQIVPHGISLSLGSAAPLDRQRAKILGDLARELDSPLVSEHIAFVRGGGVEAGHLLPVPRTRDQLAVLVRNIRDAQSMLDVPLAVENIAALVEWPDAEMDEATFLGEILDQTGALLLLDLANVHANARNLGGSAEALLDAVPLDRVAYVHVAGGEERDGLYHDTHAHETPAEVIEMVTLLSARRDVPGFMLERDEHFPTDAKLGEEMDAIAKAIASGRERRLARV